MLHKCLCPTDIYVLADNEGMKEVHLGLLKNANRPREKAAFHHDV